MFRNDAQLARVCEMLCRHVRMSGMWRWDEKTGQPTERNLAFRENTPGWSHGELVMWRIAWAVWGAEGGPVLAEIVNILDTKNAQAVGALIMSIAAGPAAIDDWLEVYRACERCGCTHDFACWGGCAWRDLPGRDVCTNCSPNTPVEHRSHA